MAVQVGEDALPDRVAERGVGSRDGAGRPFEGVAVAVAGDQRLAQDQRGDAVGAGVEEGEVPRRAEGDRVALERASPAGRDVRDRVQAMGDVQVRVAVGLVRERQARGAIAWTDAAAPRTRGRTTGGARRMEAPWTLE